VAVENVGMLGLDWVCHENNYPCTTSEKCRFLFGKSRSATATVRSLCRSTIIVYIELIKI
jgi:hypothetical protein